MRNFTIIALAVLLAAAIVSGLLFYRKYADTRDKLRVSHKELLDLNEKVTQLNKERSALQDEIKKNVERSKELESAKSRISQREDAIKAREQALQDEIKVNAERSKELESAKSRISELEEAIEVKDQALSGLDEKIRRLEEGSEEEKKIGESLRKELSSMDDMVAELREKLQMEKSMVKAKIEELKSTYDSLVSELKRQLKSKEMTIREFEEKLSITFVDRVLFDFGKADITPKGRSILKRVGEILKNVYGMQIRVVGHTDDVPIAKEYLYKFPSNWELSSARSAAVVRFFQRESGLDPKNLEVVGRSFYAPVASNETDEGRAQNRRVEVIIAPKIEE